MWWHTLTTSGASSPSCTQAQFYESARSSLVMGNFYLFQHLLRPLAPKWLFFHLIIFSSIRTCHPTFHFLKSFKNLLLQKQERENERAINGSIWLTFRRPMGSWLMKQLQVWTEGQLSIIRLLLPMALSNQLSRWPSLLLCNNFKAKTYDWPQVTLPWCWNVMTRTW